MYRRSIHLPVSSKLESYRKQLGFSYNVKATFTWQNDETETVERTLRPHVKQMQKKKKKITSMWIRPKWSVQYNLIIQPGLILKGWTGSPL